MATRAEKGAVGLDGVIAAETRLSEVDGEAGRLVLAGHDVERLASDATFEDACGLFWDGAMPSHERRSALTRELGEARIRAWNARGGLGDALTGSDGTAVLRAAIAHLGRDGEPAPTELAGALPVWAAAWWRLRSGLTPLVPDPSLGTAADYLRLLGGATSPAAARALDTYLVTVADHGMNASTFAARVVASTGSDLVSAIVAAIGALKGPLHGGAPGPVLDMLDAIGEPDRASAWLEAELAAGRRIMGMGHRIYRVRDPRAAVLEEAALRLERAPALANGKSGAAARSAVPRRLPLARAVEAAAASVLKARYPDRALCANVEFYTAVLLDSVGIPRELFTPTFAVGRVIGWSAHVAEQRATGRLIRPASRYVGPQPENVIAVR